MDVGAWLEDHRHGHYAEVVASNDIDAQLLPRSSPRPTSRICQPVARMARPAARDRVSFDARDPDMDARPLLAAGAREG